MLYIQYTGIDEQFQFQSMFLYNSIAYMFGSPTSTQALQAPKSNASSGASIIVEALQFTQMLGRTEG